MKREVEGSANGSSDREADIPEDFYERLGVSPRALPEEIKRAHRHAVKEHHPDFHMDNQEEIRESTERTASINEAWSTLSDPEKRKDYDKQWEKRHREQRTRLDEIHKEVEGEDVKARAGSYVRSDGRKYDPTHPNPFWEEQEDFLTPSDRFMGAIVGGIEEAGRTVKSAARKTRNFLQPLSFNENPDSAKRTLAEYDKMVSDGKAALMDDQKGVSYDDYRRSQKAYKKTGNFRNYYFRMVGTYDNRGNFTGRVRTYRIEKGVRGKG